MLGQLLINGIFECFTLEDIPREVKIKGETAIPAGRYQVIIDFSNRFQVRMPLIVNVPGFTGVRIHWGNWAKDTDGCPLVGTTKGVDFIGNSRAAYNRLFKKLENALKTEKVWITIVDPK